MITAHQHQTIVGQDHETYYVQAGQDAKELVHLSINFKKRTTTYDVESIDSKVIDLNEYEEGSRIIRFNIL